MEELFKNPQAIILLVFMVIAALKFVGENRKGKKQKDKNQPLAELYDQSRQQILERQRSEPPPEEFAPGQAPKQLSILDFFGPPVGSSPEKTITPSSPPPLPGATPPPPTPAASPRPKPSLSPAEKRALKRVKEGRTEVVRPRRSIRRRPIRELLSTPAAARDAIVLGEILGPPKGQQ
ncbi:MAG: hypothetical protein NZ804_13450 [Roseibacillus sp.]|nr:hypothetical protein [Deltaproteobacteria bacterium]MCS5540991.1 hypothetical protein [Roseibacillus sp.]